MARRSTIGLDVGSSGVRAAELTYGRQGATLDRLGQVPLPAGAVADGEVLDPAAVTAALRELWRTTRFTHRDVVLGIAGRRVVVREVEVPDLPAADLRAALPFQVQDVLPMPVGEAVLDFHPVERRTSASGTTTARGLLVATWRYAVEALLATVEAAGLRATAVDLSPFALLRAMGGGLEGDVHTEAIIDVGATTTHVVVHSAGVPRLVRTLLRGGQEVTEALAERAGVPTAEAEQLKRDLGLGSGAGETVVSFAVEGAVRAFVEEVRNSIDYYASANPQHPVERLVLSGGGAQLSGLAQRLSDATRLPADLGSAVRRVRPARGGPDAEQLATFSPVAAVPVGLALGASA